jgi:DNA-binding LytR/AlgR family response regulator
MKFALYGQNCREELTANGIEEDAQSRIAIVEEGNPIPDDREICIVYRPGSLALLQQLLSPGTKRTAGDNINMLTCRKDERIMLVPIKDIEFISGHKTDIRCYLKDGTELQVKKKIYEIDMILSDRGFFRVSKSTIINIREIKDISPWFGGRLLLRLKNGRDEIEVSRAYVADFKEYLDV